MHVEEVNADPDHFIPVCHWSGLTRDFICSLCLWTSLPLSTRLLFELPEPFVLGMAAPIKDADICFYFLN